MQILMTKAAFAPSTGPRKKTPDILEKGKVVDLPADEAKALIDNGYAEEIKVAKAEKPAKTEKKAEPDSPAA